MPQIFHLQEVIRGALGGYLMVRIIPTALSMSREIIREGLKKFCLVSNGVLKCIFCCTLWGRIIFFLTLGGYGYPSQRKNFEEKINRCIILSPSCLKWIL